MAMSTLPELEEFLRDSLEDASMLNRYVIDTSSCLIYQKVPLQCFGYSFIDSKDLTVIFISQAFVLDGNSLLSRIPRKSLKKLAELGSYKAAFDLKRHPAFTGKTSSLCIFFT